MFCSGENHFNIHGTNANSADCPCVHPHKLHDLHPTPACLSPIFTDASHPGSFGIFSWLSNQGELVQRVSMELHPAYMDHTVLPRVRWLSVPLTESLVATSITGEHVTLRGGRGKGQTRWQRSCMVWKLIMQRASWVWRWCMGKAAQVPVQAGESQQCKGDTGGSEAMAR